MEQKENKPHANIRGKEYYAQAIEEAKERIAPKQTPIERLRAFVQWAQSQGLCKSEYDFERKCSLSAKYISNNMHTGKGNIGTEMLGRIVRVFPQLNLAWLCTGDGAMLTSGGENNALNADYKQAYEGAMMQVEALNRIIRQLNK
uniref:XRE family transcriptional regulator n=1 Tax=Dulem virus 40 TaxID=3145758 RepID=A0AAU8AWZ3_9CAUD